jgi:hypothetical protein
VKPSSSKASRAFALGETGGLHRFLIVAWHCGDVVHGAFRNLTFAKTLKFYLQNEGIPQEMHWSLGTEVDMRSNGKFGLIALCCVGLSCSSTHDRDGTVVESRAAITATSNTKVSAWSMTVNLPSWGTMGALAQTITGQNAVNIGANSGAGVIVQCASTNQRRSVIASGGPVTVQPDSTVVDIVATGHVDLRDRVKETGNVVAPSLTVGNSVTISGKSVTVTPAVGDSLIWIASTPGGTVPGWDLQPGQSQSVAPGRYGAMSVKSTAKLILSSPGRYFFESLDLEPGSTLQLPTADQSTEVYVHGQQLILRGNISGPSGIEERFAIIYAGSNDVFAEAPMVGALIVPSANVTLRSLATPHKGSVWGKTVSLDAGAKLQPAEQLFLLTLAKPSTGKCTLSIMPKHTGNKRQDEFNFQYEMLRYCISVGMSDDLLRLNGKFNYESSEAIVAVYKCTIQPNQELAFVNRRTAQLAAASANATLAHQMATGPDADGDWVPDASDKCPNTPLWTPVDDNGCPIAVPSGGPSCSDLAQGFTKMGLVYNSSCPSSAGFPAQVAFGAAVYWKQSPNKGVYVYVQDVPPPSQACSSWYLLDVRALKAGQTLDHFYVSFPYAQANHTGSIVPTIPPPYVELHADPTAAGNVGKLGLLAAEKEAGTIDEVLWRVQLVTGMGAHGAWSTWHQCVPEDCNSIGFTCSK